MLETYFVKPETVARIASLHACAGQATFQLRSPSRATTSLLPPSAAT